MTHRRRLIAAAVALLPFVAAPAAPDAFAGLETELERRGAEGRFSGAVLLVKGDDVVFSQAVGLANVEQHIPNSLDTKFRFGSMGKMFTAVAILQLEQAGKLRLDAPLGKYLPDYPNAETARVTLHQLLTHTGGTGDIFGPEFESHRADLRELRDYVTKYGDRKPAFPPGSRHEYSNYGFILLGRVIETVSGQSYDRYVREHVFLPAAMTSSGNEPESAGIDGLAVPYTGDPHEPRSAANLLPYRGTSAGGGYSTVGDLGRFALALRANRLLDAAHTKLLTTGKVDTPLPGLRYAYGFEDAHLPNGVRRQGHGGGAPGMNGLLAIYPETDYVLVVLSNRDPPSALEVERSVVDSVVSPGSRPAFAE